MRKRKEMVELVAKFLGELDPSEVEPAVLMLLGRAFQVELQDLGLELDDPPGCDPRTHGSHPQTILKRFQRNGRFGFGRSDNFSSRRRLEALVAEGPLDLLEVTNVFGKMADATGPGSRERKSRLLEGLLRRATPREVKYIVKTVVGEMRTGFQEGMMELAVSKAFDLELGEVRRGVIFTGDIAEIAGIAARGGEEAIGSIGPTLFRPIQPALAQNAENIEEAIQTHGGETGFEHKLDGARVQIKGVPGQNLQPALERRYGKHARDKRTDRAQSQSRKRHLGG